MQCPACGAGNGCRCGFLPSVLPAARLARRPARPDRRKRLGESLGHLAGFLGHRRFVGPRFARAGTLARRLFREGRCSLRGLPAGLVSLLLVGFVLAAANRRMVALVAAADDRAVALSLRVLCYRRLSVRYLLTTQRLIHERGILRRVNDRIELLEIDDITVEQGIWERMAGVGTIRILFARSHRSRVALPGIENVHEVAAASRRCPIGRASPSRSARGANLTHLHSPPRDLARPPALAGNDIRVVRAGDEMTDCRGREAGPREICISSLTASFIPSHWQRTWLPSARQSDSSRSHLPG